MDRMSKEQRSYLMSRIKGKDTKPETYFRKLLYHSGYRYRLHRKDLPGRPDIWLGRYGAAVFVHGCFWHCHGCGKGNFPKSNLGYWGPKLEANKARDRRNIAALKEKEIRIAIVWECAVDRMRKDEAYRTEALDTIREFLDGDSGYLEIGGRS